MNTDGVRDPFAHRPAGYYEAIPEELQRALDGTPALHPDSIPHLWDCILLRYLDPLGRLAPTYPEAIMELAHGIALRWRPSARDLQRLEELGAGDLAGARWLLVLMALHSSEPSLGEGDPRAMVRTITASTIRVCRRILRGPHEAKAWILIGAMDRGARGLRKPLEDRLHDQWVRAEKKGGMALEAQELILALTMISPPSPQEATRLFTEVADALAGALARRWKTRWEQSGKKKDKNKKKPKAAPRDTLERLSELTYAETGGQGTPEERKDAKERLKREFVKVGLLAALAERSAPKKIRKGNVYLAEGHPLVPADDVSFMEFVRWLKRTTINNAEKELRGADPLRGTGREDKLPPEKAPPVQEQDPRVDALYAAARDAVDKALLARLADGYTMSDAARGEGLSREAGKKRFQRLKRRAGLL